MLPFVTSGASFPSCPQALATPVSILHLYHWLSKCYEILLWNHTVCNLWIFLTPFESGHTALMLMSTTPLFSNAPFCSDRIISFSVISLCSSKSHILHLAPKGRVFNNFPLCPQLIGSPPQLAEDRHSLP